MRTEVTSDLYRNGFPDIPVPEHQNQKGGLRILPWAVTSRAHRRTISCVETVLTQQQKEEIQRLPLMNAGVVLRQAMSGDETASIAIEERAQADSLGVRGERHSRDQGIRREGVNV